MVRVLRFESEIVLIDDARYEQNVLGVLRVRTREEIKEATVETPTG